MIKINDYNCLKKLVMRSTSLLLAFIFCSSSDYVFADKGQSQPHPQLPHSTKPQKNSPHQNMGKILLKKGSTVRIPQQYFVYFKDNQKIDIDDTMFNWMGQVKELSPQYELEQHSKKPKAKWDDSPYFYLPVQILDAANNSSVLKDQIVYLSITSWKQQGKTVNFTIIEDVTAITTDEMENLIKEGTFDNSSNAPLDTIYKGAKIDVNKNNRAPAATTDVENTENVENVETVNTAAKLTSEPAEPTEPALQHLNETTEATSECIGSICDQNHPLVSLNKRIEASTISSVVKAQNKKAEIERNIVVKQNFIKSCCSRSNKSIFQGKSCYKEFLLELQKTENSHIPIMPHGLLFGMMSQESTGKCTEKHGGLFQISKSKKKLANPIVNLQEAIRVINEKISDAKLVLNRDCQLNLEDFNKTDQWRLIVAIYNGGAKYIGPACNDAKIYAKQHPEISTIASWNIFRTFALQRYLSNPKKLRGIEINTRHIAVVLGNKDITLSSGKIGPWISDAFDSAIKDS